MQAPVGVLPTRLVLIVVFIACLFGIIVAHGCGSIESGSQSSSSDPAAPSAPTNVILVIGDSMSWPLMQAMNAVSPLPGLSRMMVEGATATHGVAAVPSLTVTNRFTLLTGAHPDATGEVGNVFIRSVSPPVDTLEDVATREGLSYRLTFSDSAIDEVIAEVNNGTLPNIRIAWDSSIDTVGHIFGPGSSQYENAIRVSDSKIHQLMDAIVGAGEFDSTVVVLGADHGMEDLTADGTPSTLRKVDVGAILTAAGIANEWRGSGPRMAHIYLADTAQADDAVTVLQATEGVDANVFKRGELTRLELANDIVIELDSPNSGDVISFMLRGYSNGRTTSPFYWDTFDSAIGGHDGLSLEEMHVPWLMWGGAIKAGFSMGPKHQVDHAATIAALLGVEPPLFSEGTAAVEAFRSAGH